MLWQLSLEGHCGMPLQETRKAIAAGKQQNGLKVFWEWRTTYK